MNIGVGQTGDTCWFNSSLNIFLTSDNGLKILWQKLIQVYARLGPKQKAYFDSNIRAPCPYGKPNKTPANYFWKFLNQYICAIGGPGSLIPRSGLNAYLTKNIKWINAGMRESKGTAGGWPHLELRAILQHLGFQQGKDFRIRKIEYYRYQFPATWTNPILLFHGESTGFSYSGMPLRDLLLYKRGYDLTGAVVYVRPQDETGQDPHVWSCSIRNGRGYVTDSNSPTEPKQCDWWIKTNLLHFFNKVDFNFRPVRARMMVYDVLMYTRRKYTDTIAPYCLLPKQGYRPLTNANKENLAEFKAWGPEAVRNIGKGNGLTAARKKFAPRVLAEAIRENSKRIIINSNMLQKIVNEAGSFNHGMRIFQGMIYSNKYKINQNGTNFLKFVKNLKSKFPSVPVPKNMFIHFWRTSKSNTDFANKLRKWVNKTPYTLNENKIKAIIATRAKTRASAKRVRNVPEERMYLVNNRDWFNSNGTNVTNKINASNWILTNNNNITPFIKNHTITNNVKTYKRKLANYNKNMVRRSQLMGY